MSNVVERREWLGASLVSLATAIARRRLDDSKESTSATDGYNLISAKNRMQIVGNSTVDLVNSNAVVDILNHAAMKFAHASGDINGNVYLEKLKSWAASSRDKITDGGAELPDGLPLVLHLRFPPLQSKQMDRSNPIRPSSESQYRSTILNPDKYLENAEIPGQKG
ncbi:hypothetical protein FISHEDRAFT_68593 [Fistulina hepatica ATCC 64428]|uniref:Uncharacterized protein n=1 Tax=Fistulina hepatica ATCC 64428 TaxID=1128425 RepID=A0A0D7AQB3_9AGAR|nr:hypothetical protein FISHEDRAFT_68593 [Fistulina hepatica ATCC 64428]